MMEDNKLIGLKGKYPKIFPEHFYFECSDGWYDLLDDLCYKLQSYVDDFDNVEQIVAAQVKEKFGSLRFYIEAGGGDDYIYSLINDAEKKSSLICEDCGEPGKVQSLGRWLMCRCPICFAKAEEARKNRGY